VRLRSDSKADKRRHICRGRKYLGLSVETGGPTGDIRWMRLRLVQRRSKYRLARRRSAQDMRQEFRSERGVTSKRCSREVLDQLVADARNGSTHAMNILLEALSECLRAEFVDRPKGRYVSPSRGPSDLVQETLIRVRRHFDRFQEGSFGALTGWARSILSNYQLEVTRNTRTRNTPERRERIWYAIQLRAGGNQNVCPPEMALGRSDDVARGNRAREAYSRLSVDQQTIIELRLFEGLTYPEISALTRLKPEAARKAFRRALDRLTEQFLSNANP
jgi:RNA polymerase sigma factor (sigma-70 family)